MYSFESHQTIATDIRKMAEAVDQISLRNHDVDRPSKAGMQSLSHG